MHMKVDELMLVDCPQGSALYSISAPVENDGLLLFSGCLAASDVKVYGTSEL